ncbi:hypothetical protein KJ359_000192 [Pestalotiopsis sp. 9143b]|nr:hypothetical protein KJ359_000192 [Pestalotiopsis sp. 9143b]
MGDTEDVGDAPLRQLAYLLTPLYDNVDDNSNNKIVKAINVQGTLPENSNVEDVLATSFTRYGDVELGRLDLDSVIVFDDLGILDITHNLDESTDPLAMEWRVSRPSLGTVGMSYTVFPRVVDCTTPNGAPCDLRQEFGGLSGSGYAFLVGPQNEYNADGSLEDFEVTLSWDLTGAPPGTSSAWTWGTGTGPFTFIANSTQLCSTYFMVGKIDALSVSRIGFYCLGSSPVHKESMVAEVGRTFRYAAEFFIDDLECSKNDSEDYRVFMRYNPYPGCTIASSCGRSFVVTYYVHDATDPKPVEGYLETLNHEVVHNWVKLDPVHKWYSEGLADYYRLFLPQYAGIASREEFQVTLNSLMTMYYTNPFVACSSSAASEAAKECWNAAQIPYGRGLVFALKLDALIRDHDKAGKGCSIDIVVQILVWMQRYQGLGSLTDFLIELGNFLPGGCQQAIQLHKDMSSGVLVVPPINSLAHLGLQVTRRDVRVWELGFDEDELLTGDCLVHNLNPDSAAATSGLQEGDVVLASYPFIHATKDDEHRPLDLLIRRGEGEPFEVSFLPRGERLMERWIYVEREDL